MYDGVDADVLQCYHEMTLANLLFHAMKEGACSEQSSRMTAMDSASKNASKPLPPSSTHTLHAFIPLYLFSLQRR